MDKRSQTVQTYNQSAQALADKFDNLGARVSDIEETLALVNKKNPKVLEIGCGNGRDAAQILKITNNYIGIDISEELIKIAKEKVLGANFKVVDVSTYDFPSDLDIIFAFASLIHVTKEEFKSILEKLFNSMNAKGVIRISLKYSPEYREITQEDEFGIRTYYYYSREDIVEMIGDNFNIVKNKIEDIKGTEWLELILQKR